MRKSTLDLGPDRRNFRLPKEPQTKFLIVGGGNRDQFERFVRWYGMRDKVLFTGFMANRSLQQVFRIADVAAFPSLYEPFGIVALEAMAAGTPVVASDAGGLREVVLHDETGTHCYANNPESLAWAVLEVLQKPERAKKLAANAKKRLAKDFDWSGIADQTIATYHRVWEEFLSSYWAAETLWPVTPGATERAERKHVQEKAKSGLAASRPRPAVAMPRPPATLDHEE